MQQNYNKKRKLNKLKASLLLLMTVLFAMPAVAQQTINMTNGTAEVGTGGVNFYDSGGAGGGAGRYRHNEDYTYTFTLPALQSDQGLKVVFSTLRVNDDHLYIYEGTAMNDANLIADFTCNDWYYSFTDLTNNGTMPIPGDNSTLTNPITIYSHGAITFRFVSNEQYRDSGWEATINIIDPDDIDENPPAPVIAMRACENVVELIPTMIPTQDEGTLDLYYNIGGTDIKYTEPFNVANGTTVTAYAKLGENQSATNHSVTVNRAAIAAPTITREDENNNNLIKITRPSVPSGANDTYKVRYTIDGTDPTTSSTAITINWVHVTGVADRNDTIIDISAAVWLSPSGNFQVKAVTQGTTCPDLMSAQTTYTTTNLFTCTPVITLTGTTETGTINITCATANSTIYYTVDGSTPTPNATGTYVWGAEGAPTTISAGGTVRAIATASNHLNSHMASETYVPGGTSGSGGVYGGIVLLNDREDHSWTYYSDNNSPIKSLKPADVKITYTGYGTNTMTSTSTDNMPANSAFDTDVAANQVAVNVNEAGNQFIYLKTLENANEDGSGNYPYTMIHNPFQVRPNNNTTTTATSRTVYFNWGRSNRDTQGTLTVTYTNAAGQSNQTQTFSINGTGSGNITARVGTTISYSLIKTAGGNNRYVYFTAGYTNNGTQLITQRTCSSTTTPTTGTSGNIVAPDPVTTYDWRGFYAWRVKSLGGGLTISGKEVGSIIYPDETIEFVTSNAEGNEVEFEALWAKAWVNESSSSNRATNSGNYKNAYERNFKTSYTSETYPVTYSSRYPDGTVATTSSFSVGSLDAGADIKFENMTLTADRLNGNNHSLHIGRGVGNGTNNVTSAVYGYRNPGTTINDFVLRVESGRYTNLYTFYGNGTTISSAFRQNTIYGSDYDRAKKDNSKLVATGAVEVGYYTFTSSSSSRVNVLALSGTFGTNTGDVEFYMGCEYGSSSNSRSVYRSLEVLGGEYLGGIAGGVDKASSTSTEILKMRIKGGTIHRYFYGGGQYSETTGSRKMIVTGGTFDAWISGGCYGTETSGGATNGNTYVYFGGKAKQTNSGGIFGAGYGSSGQGNGYYTVANSKVVAADEAQIAGSVYGGGNNGYCTDGSEVYVKGTTLNIAGSVYGGANLARTEGNVTVTVKGGTIAGSVYGGAWGNTATSDIVYVTGSATVDVSGGTMSNVYGAGLGSRTVIRGNTSVTVSGGTINNNVYGGGEQGAVGRSGNNQGANAVVTVSGGEVKGNVYGAGKGTQSETVPFTSANIYGTTTVNISDEARVKGSVYGGGENGSVGYYNNSSTATGSTVNVSGGVVDKDVFGGGSYGVTNGNVVVNITWANDELAKTNIKGSVYGGAYGKRNKVYVKGTRTVNMNNGLVGQSLYGGSRNADDGLEWSPSASSQTNTCNVVNISGGEVEYQVFAAGFFGHTYGSVYAFIGQNAIKTAPEHAMTQAETWYAINPLRIRGSVWAGADFGNFDGQKFGDPTVEGNSYVYIDGTNYNTIINNPQNSTYMYVEGSVYGCGTSCDAGKTDTKVVVRNYGQPVASGSKNIDEPYQTATRSLYSIQRAKYVILDNAHINYVGQGKVNSLVTTEKYAIHNVSVALRVVNGSSVMINYPIDEIKMLLNGKCADVYAATPSYSSIELSDISVENKYRVYNGTYINVFYTSEALDDDGNTVIEEKYGELSGFAYMMTDAYQGEDDTKSCAYARPKWGQGASFELNDPDYDNRADGGFISYTATYNEFDATGYNSANGVQMRYENHVYTNNSNSKVGEDYFRIWRYGGVFSYREAVLIARSSGAEGTYNICDATVELPATEPGGYYRIQAVEGNGGTTINYGTDASTCNVGFYGDTYSTETNEWMTYTGTAFVPGQAMTATNVQNGLHVIDGYPNVNFGLVAIPSGAMESTTNDNWLICESSDAALAGVDTKWTYSNEQLMPEVLFRLTYSNEISVNKVLDPITIYFEQYKPKYNESNQIIGYDLVDVVQVALIITTKTSIEQNVKTRVVAIMNGTGELGDVYSGRVTLPSYSVNLTQNEDPSTWTLQSVTWNAELSGAQLVANQQGNYEGSDSKFAMMFYASTNKDNTYGWDEWQGYGPYDAASVASGVTVGKTYARKDFTINFDLYYDGTQESTTQKLGTMTFVFAFNHYGNGDENKTLTITIDVYRKGTGENYYLDGVNGDNAYAGTRPDAAKKTLAAILTRTEYMAGDNIFIVNTVTQDVAATLSWDGFEYDHITIYRYPGGHRMAKDETDPTLFPIYYEDYPAANPCFKGVMVDVKTKMEMHYVTIDGFADEIEKVKAATTQQPYTPVGGAIDASFVEAFAATAPMFEVENNGQLTLANNTLLTHNANTSTDNHGGAVKVDEGGTLNMTIESKIQGNAAAGKGGGVYMDGTMNISGNADTPGVINVTGNTKLAGSKAEAQASNIYLNKFAPGVVTMTGEIDEESRLGITKDEWNGKWYTPVVYSDVAARLDVFYDDFDLGRVTDDKEMYELNELPTLTDFNNPTKYLFFVGTWVTAVTSEPDGFAANNINSAEDLAWAISVATGYNKVNEGNGYPSTNFKLTADIDMDDNIWVPIGNSNVKYTGTFDGNGHVVTGIRSPLDETDKAMFGVIDGATITNMVARTNFPEGNSQNLAALVGVMEKGTISNCEAAGALVGTSRTENIGGVVAKANGGTIHSVFAVNTLTGAGESVMGGLVGTNGANLYNSYSNVTMNGDATAKGGLVGVNNANCHIENCYTILGESTFPAFAATNNGIIQYCYADKANYIGGGTQPSDHSTYGAVQSDIKHLDYMYRDNIIAGGTNQYVGAAGISAYVDNHIPVWNGLLSALNQWVRNTEVEGDFASWCRPITTGINGDLPVLVFDNDNSMASPAYYEDGSDVLKDAKMIYYTNDFNGMLGNYNAKNDDAYMFLYGAASDVAAVPVTKVKVSIAEDAVLTQTADADAFTATVGVTFDNSCRNASDYWGNKLEYDWHLMSSPLSDAKIGITYKDQAEHGFGSGVDINGISGSYFPNGLGDYAWLGGDVKWDMYSYYEPEYHWINFKRNPNNHYHYDDEYHVHAHITYNEPDQANGTNSVFTPGKGYFMAISQDSYMNSTGTLNKGSLEAINLTYNGKTAPYNPGANLLGNPYQAYLDLTKITDANSKISQFYIYDADQGVYAPYTEDASSNPCIPSRYIHPHQAFFALVSEATSLTFAPSMAGTTKDDNGNSFFRGGEEQVNYPVVNLFAENATGNRDLTIVELNRPEMGGAAKINELRNANFQIAAALDGQRYGILFTPEGTERVPVHFTTAEDGTYTLRWNMHNGEFTSLILVDNVTGAVCNMLTNNHYTFEASADDYASRFYITYTVTGVDENNEGDGSFAFFDGSEWVVSGKGQLDVIDVTGRVLRSQRLVNERNRVSLNGVAKGVYLLRVSDGKNTMVQKIVVR